MIVRYYSVLKRKETLIHIMIYMNPEDMLNEISQSQKQKVCTITLI